MEGRCQLGPSLRESDGFVQVQEGRSWGKQFDCYLAHFQQSAERPFPRAQGFPIGSLFNSIILTLYNPRVCLACIVI